MSSITGRTKAIHMKGKSYIVTQLVYREHFWSERTHLLPRVDARHCGDKRHGFHPRDIYIVKELRREQNSDRAQAWKLGCLSMDLGSIPQQLVTLGQSLEFAKLSPHLQNGNRA